MMRKKTYKIKPDVRLRNKFNNEVVAGDVVNEEEIEGKLFWVIKQNARTMKLAKEAYVLQHGR
jgi:hypothetical protein